MAFITTKGVLVLIMQMLAMAFIIYLDLKTLYLQKYCLVGLIHGFRATNISFKSNNNHLDNATRYVFGPLGNMKNPFVTHNFGTINLTLVHTPSSHNIYNTCCPTLSFPLSFPS